MNPTLIMRLIADTTFQSPLIPIKIFLILIGEIIAVVISTVSIHFLSKKQITLENSFLIGSCAMTLSFLFGVAFWVTIGWW